MLLGKQRTRVRRALAALVEAHPDPTDLARVIEVRVHTARAVLGGRLLPGRRCAEGIARATGQSLSALLGAPMVSRCLSNPS